MVFNPNAGSGRAARLLAALRQSLEAFARLELLQASDAGAVRERIAAADLDRYDGLLVAGGDGTLFEALNGMYAHPARQRLPLGVIPVGTGNAFARDLGLAPGDWRRSVAIVREGRRRRVDIGRVEYDSAAAVGGQGCAAFHFVNIVGAGLPVDALHTAERLKALGPAAYSVAAFWQALRLRSHPLRLEADGETLEEDALFVEVANTRYTGASFLMAPAARFDDGMLDLVLLRRLPRHRLLRLFPTIYDGSHVTHPEVLTRRVRELRILAPEGLELVPDGEFRGHTPALIRCLERDLEIFA